MNTEVTTPESHDHNDHELSYKFLTSILAVLLALTALTVYSAQFHFGNWNTFVSLAIASTKGTVVALFFMHLKYENRVIVWSFIVTLIMLAIFIGFMLVDINVRYH